MRIGIDATAVDPGTGASSYMFNLTKNILCIDERNEYVIYCQKEIPNAFRIQNRRIQFKICNLGNRKVCEQLWLSFRGLYDSLDVLHCCWSLPLVAPRTSVLTVHGLAWRVMPEMFTMGIRLYLKLGTERSIRKAKRIIAISEWTKNLCIEHMNLEKQSIDVVHHGVDLQKFSHMTNNQPTQGLKERYSLPHKFILYVGATLPVKNIPFLVKSFGKLIKDDRFKDYYLVLAGGKGWGHEAVLETVQRLDLRRRVVFPGFIRDEDLPTLYNAAELFIFPSMFEGFGIPILESMACGTPVLAANTSCLPEVGGDAALYFDPHDEEELVRITKNVLTDEALRETMMNKGLMRVKEFTWEKTAEKTLKVYEKTLATN